MAMADEMQGIMSLPDQPPMEQTAAPTAEQSAAVEQMRSQLSPSEINTEMLGAAEQADPATVAEFKAELQGLELPPEVLDMLNTMVEEILDAPQDYEAIGLSTWPKVLKISSPLSSMPPSLVRSIWPSTRSVGRALLGNLRWSLALIT